MNVRNHDDWTVERWRVEPHWRALGDIDESEPVEPSPPLWKDLAVASVAALLLWGAAVVMFG